MLAPVFITAAAVIACGLLPFLLLRAYALRVERGPGDETDKVHRLRRASLIAGLIGPFVVAAAGTAVLSSTGEESSRVPFVVGVLLSLGATLVGLSLGVGPSYRRIRGIHQTAGERFRKGLRISLVLLIPMALWIGIRIMLSSTFEEQPVLRLAGSIVFLILFTATAPMLIAWLVPGRPPPEGLAGRIDALARKLRVRIGGVRLLESRAEKVANALVAGTIPRWRYVFLTDHLVDRFDEDEVDAVVAHELGHAKQHHLLVKVGVFLGLYTLLILPAFFVDGGEGGDANDGTVVAILGLALAMALLVGLFLIQGAVGIWLEKRADRFAAEVVGADAMARALDRLATENAARKRTGRLWNLLQQHPGIADRIEDLRRRGRRAAPVSGRG
jgi:STE24 endopeptidase